MTDFATLAAIAEAARHLPGPDQGAIAAAKRRNELLTKPQGALGRLETLAIWYAGWRGAPKAEGCRGQALVFAGNHGVAARGVSPYPSDVTAQMVGNFAAGGAAINQLCRLHNVALSVHALELETPTADFTAEPAMSEAAFGEAVAAGWDAVDPNHDALILGEMGIGNTTAATAVAIALLGGSVEEWTGRGAGLDDAGLAVKRAVINAGLEPHRDAIAAAAAELKGLEALRRFGGREMAAILGACLRARRERMVVLLDGLIATSSVLPLSMIVADPYGHCVAGHASVEPAHRAILETLGLAPLVDLGLRLGEGSGAALAFSVLQSALACHAGMATFEEAAVSGPA